ncbi:MAG: EamA family transporter, partial [Bacteroidetes bacterium]|nr:EamA family transporter [Bacteroidota bacterium]
MDKKTNILYYFHLHFIVLIWGFTGILGKLITLDAFALVWYRLFIAVTVLCIILLAKKIKIDKTYAKQYMLMGVVVALHWLSFYGAIKVSNVSVALSAFSCTAFFTAFLEPIIFKRKIRWQEVAPGI